MKEVLDIATAVYARRPLALLLCSALSLAPVGLATGAFVDQVLAPQRPSLFGLLGVGVLSAAAWLAFCWGQAASVRVCRGELTGESLTLAEAIRRGLEDVPRVMVAAATRLLVLALGALPAGAGLPHAGAFTVGLVPAAVLDGAGPRAGLARARRAPRAHAVAQALPWALAPVVWLNLVMAYATLLGWLVRIDPGHLESALRDGPALAMLGAVAWWVVDPLRAAAAVGAHGAWQREVQGHDLVRAAGRTLVLWLAISAGAGPAHAQTNSPGAWSAYLWEAREAVLAQEAGAADQVLTLLGREVSVAEGQVVMVTDPVLARLSARLAAGEQGAMVDVVHHLVVLEHLALRLERSQPLGDSWPATAPPARATVPRQTAGLRTALDAAGESAGRLQAWAGGADPTAHAVLGGHRLVGAGVLALSCGLFWLLRVGRDLDGAAVGVGRAPTAASPPLPDALQGTARAAVRQGFLATLAVLERTGRVDDVARKTNGQIAARLDGTLWARFRSAREAFEGTWYGDLPAGEPELLAVDEALASARGEDS